MGSFIRKKHFPGLISLLTFSLRQFRKMFPIISNDTLLEFVATDQVRARKVIVIRTAKIVREMHRDTCSTEEIFRRE